MNRRIVVLLTAAMLALPVQGGALVDLAAEATRPAVNDMVRATVFSEASGNNPGELARRVNADVGEALRLIRGKPGVSVKSGQQSTFPVYGQAQKIEQWRMRSELIIESKDQAIVSELLGKLQQMRLAVGQVSHLPSPETRRQAEDEAMREAIAAFQNRAALVAAQLGKTWRLKQLNLNQSGSQPVPMMRAARGVMMAAEAAPMPLEAGESQVACHVTGQIELAD